MEFPSIFTLYKFPRISKISEIPQVFHEWTNFSGNECLPRKLWLEFLVNCKASQPKWITSNLFFPFNIQFNVFSSANPRKVWTRKTNFPTRKNIFIHFHFLFGNNSIKTSNFSANFLQMNEIENFCWHFPINQMDFWPSHSPISAHRSTKTFCSSITFPRSAFSLLSARMKRYKGEFLTYWWILFIHEHFFSHRVLIH